MKEPLVVEPPAVDPISGRATDIVAIAVLDPPADAGIGTVLATVVADAVEIPLVLPTSGLAMESVPVAVLDPAT